MRTIVVGILNKPADHQLTQLPVVFHGTNPPVRYITHCDPRQETSCAQVIYNYDIIIDMAAAGEPTVAMVIDIVQDRLKLG